MIIITIFIAPLPGLGQVEEGFFFYPEHTQEYNPKRQRDYLQLKLVPKQGSLLFVWQDNNDGEPGNHSVCPTRLMWEVDAQSKAFTLKDQEIADANGNYWQICRTSDQGYQPLLLGKIEGEKLKNGNWSVQVNVKAIGHLTGKEYTFEFNETFLPYPAD